MKGRKGGVRDNQPIERIPPHLKKIVIGNIYGELGEALDFITEFRETGDDPYDDLESAKRIVEQCLRDLIKYEIEERII